MNCDASKMQLTPAQIAVRLICGEKLPGARMSHDPDILSRVKRGHDMLVKLSGKDFKYDLVAWHTYLKQSRDGGYTWGRNILLPRVMKKALVSNEWHEAINKIQSRG